MQIVYVQRKKKPFSSEPVQRRTVANDDEFVETLKNAARDLVSYARAYAPSACTSTVRPGLEVEHALSLS